MNNERRKEGRKEGRKESFKRERVIVNSGDTKAPEKQRALRKQVGRLSHDEGPVTRCGGRWRSRHSAQFSRVQVPHEASDTHTHTHTHLTYGEGEMYMYIEVLRLRNIYNYL